MQIDGELTLLDLVLIVQEFTASEEETVEMISALLERGRVRLRSAPFSDRKTRVERAARRIDGGRTESAQPARRL